MEKSITKLPRKKELDESESLLTPMVPKSTLNNLDGLSRNILALLQEDGRRSFSSIARELNVSEGAVRSRVNYLEEKENLRFLAVIDPLKVGYRAWAMLGITVSNGASPHKLALEFSKNPQAIWVGVVGGEFDLIVETWTETPEDLHKFLEDYCYSNEQVASVHTMVGMRIYKWGVPQF